MNCFYSKKSSITFFLPIFRDLLSSSSYIISLNSLQFHSFFPKNYLLVCICNDAFFCFLSINWDHVLVLFNIFWNLIESQQKFITFTEWVPKYPINKCRLLWAHSLVHAFREFRSGFRGFGAWLLGPMNMVSGQYECMEEAVGFKADRKQRSSKGLRIRYDFQSWGLRSIRSPCLCRVREKDLSSFFFT